MLGQAGGDQSCDRNGHVRPQYEDPAGLVEEPVGAVQAAAVGTFELVGELHHRRPDLAVPVAGERPPQVVLDRAQLRGLDRQHVARAARQGAGGGL